MNEHTPLDYRVSAWYETGGEQEGAKVEVWTARQVGQTTEKLREFRISGKALIHLTDSHDALLDTVKTIQQFLARRLQDGPDVRITDQMPIRVEEVRFLIGRANAAIALAEKETP